MNVRDAVLSRHSCRSFTQRTIDAAILRDLLDTARFAPSGGNLQPWLVHVLSGDSMLQFRSRVTPKLQVEPLGGAAEYHVYPPPKGSTCRDRKSTRLNSSHQIISYAVFCLKKKKDNKLYPINTVS